ncbi:G5 domain-containing protein [Bacillus sp. CH30_1T]|uniref:G5 domain-containing protein n=1 Tax=Bacillus sp. CH30_1T TaxID=2604836 RepID=UPI00165E9B9F|nr:G5 domain-containing protein [Bacillus sp. CH30_1T]
MSKTLPFTKLSVFFVLCSIYMFGFAHIGAFAYDHFISSTQSFSEGTKIGNIDVSHLSYQEAEDKLKVKVEGWKENQSLVLSYMENQIPMDPSLVDIDIHSSINSTIQGNPSPLLVSIQGLDSFLASKEVDVSLIDLDSLRQEIAHHAEKLVMTEEIVIVNDFFIQSNSVETISEINMEGVTMTPGIQSFVDTFPEIEIGGTSPFSLLEFIENKGFSGASQQDLSTIASSIYELVLRTNFEVIERHRGRELPDNIELGFEAIVNHEQGQDFSFMNPNDASYIVSFHRQGDSLFLTLSGVEIPYEIIVERRNEETFKPKVIKQYSPYLNSGEVKVTEAGRNGMKIEVWRSFETKNGELLKEEKVSEDFYLPIFKEEIHSMQDYVTQQPVSSPGTNRTDSLNEEVNSRESPEPQGNDSHSDNNGTSDPIGDDDPSANKNSNDESSPSEEDSPLGNMK